MAKKGDLLLKQEDLKRLMQNDLVVSVKSCKDSEIRKLAEKEMYNAKTGFNRISAPTPLPKEENVDEKKSSKKDSKSKKEVETKKDTEKIEYLGLYTAARRLLERDLSNVAYAKFGYSGTKSLLLCQTCDVKESMDLGFVYAPGVEDFVLDIGKRTYVSNQKVDRACPFNEYDEVYFKLKKNDPAEIAEIKKKWNEFNKCDEKEDSEDEDFLETYTPIIEITKPTKKQIKGQLCFNFDVPLVGTNERCYEIIAKKVITTDEYVLDVFYDFYHRRPMPNEIDSSFDKEKILATRPYLDCVISLYRDNIDITKAYTFDKDTKKWLKGLGLILKENADGTVYLHALNVAEEIEYVKDMTEELVEDFYEKVEIVKNITKDNKWCPKTKLNKGDVKNIVSFVQFNEIRKKFSPTLEEMDSIINPALESKKEEFFKYYRENLEKARSILEEKDWNPERKLTEKGMARVVSFKQFESLCKEFTPVIKYIENAINEFSTKGEEIAMKNESNNIISKDAWFPNNTFAKEKIEKTISSAETEKLQKEFAIAMKEMQKKIS